MPSLPELTYRELMDLLRHFDCTIIRGKDSPCVGLRNRSGKPFVIHHHPGRAVWPEKLRSILKDMEVSLQEFWEWRNRK